MSKSPNPRTASRLAALFPADAATGRHATDAALGPHRSDAPASSRHAAASPETPPPGVPPPGPDPWAGVPEPVGGGSRDAAADRDASAEPLPAATRFAATVADRIPPGLKAFRIAVDGRVVAAVAALALLAIVIAGVGWWRSRPQTVAVPAAVAASASGAAVGADSGTAAPGATAGSLGSGAPRPDPLALPASAALAASTDPSAAAAAASVSVHVVGRVARPGLFALPAGSRVDDALKAAGGALPGTDLAALNLARVLSDGEQVPVGVPGATAVPAPAGAPAASAAGKGAANGAAAGVVDLNTATAEQLEGLPGIGPVMAASILDWRRAHGRFTSVEQLREIRGIGERRFEELRPRVRV
ncbi:helix-hairpin-helix domain-containing protein [Streptodolium elevatio]